MVIARDPSSPFPELGLRERERERERERIGVLKNRIEIGWGRREGWIDDEKSNLGTRESPKVEKLQT